MHEGMKQIKGDDTTSKKIFVTSHWVVVQALICIHLNQWVLSTSVYIVKLRLPAVSSKKYTIYSFVSTPYKWVFKEFIACESWTTKVRSGWVRNPDLKKSNNSNALSVHSCIVIEVHITVDITRMKKYILFYEWKFSNYRVRTRP